MFSLGRHSAYASALPKTATEINVKTQGQMTRLAMIVDTINQDLIIPNVEKRIVGRVRSVLREQNT